MFIVAGPPGSGKSTAFPVAEFGTRYFNADDRAAQLNGGSYVGITPEVRSAVNREFEEFIRECVARRDSFAIETTLRTTVTFDQAQAAKARGFWVEMRYLALRDFAMHLERVMMRADAGGHSAPESQLRKIYESSLGNLRQAIEEMDDIWIYDNSKIGGPPKACCADRKRKDRLPVRRHSSVAKRGAQRLGISRTAGIPPARTGRGSRWRSFSPPSPADLSKVP